MKWREFKDTKSGRWQSQHRQWCGRKRGVLASVHENNEGFSTTVKGYSFMLYTADEAHVYNSAWHGPPSPAREAAQEAAERMIDAGWPTIPSPESSHA